MIKTLFTLFVFASFLYADDTLNCQSRYGNAIILRSDHTWQALQQSKSISTPKIDTLSLWPPKKVYNHPEFSEEIDALFYYEKKYDKFKDVTAESVGFPVTKNLRMSFLDVKIGSDKKIPTVISIKFMSNSDDWKFLRSSNLSVIADNERINLGKLDHHGSVGTGYVLEFMSLIIPIEDFLKIINSKSVEMQLFNVEFSMNNEQLEALKDYASRLY